MDGDAGGRSSSSKKVPRAGTWETCQIFRFERIAHARTFPTIGLDGSTRRQPTVTPIGVVIPHSPSRWVLQKNTSTTLFLLREIPPNFPQIRALGSNTM